MKRTLGLIIICLLVSSRLLGQKPASATIYFEDGTTQQISRATISMGIQGAGWVNGGGYIFARYKKTYTQLPLEKIREIQILDAEIPPPGQTLLQNIRVKIITRTGVAITNGWSSFSNICGFVMDELTGESKYTTYTPVFDGRLSYRRIKFHASP